MEKNTTKTEVREKIQELLKTLKAEQEKKPLRLVEQLGYLMYVRLFIESQKRVSLQESFPFAGFPMEWIPGEEEVEDGQRSWQLQYQVQYCSSMVEQGHFMETARLEENSLWMKELCKLIDWTADHCDWEEGMPHLFGVLLEEMLRQMYAWGTTGLFLMPENLTEALIWQMVVISKKSGIRRQEPAVFLQQPTDSIHSGSYTDVKKRKVSGRLPGCCSFIMAAVWRESVGKIRWKPTASIKPGSAHRKGKCRPTRNTI